VCLGHVTIIIIIREIGNWHNGELKDTDCEFNYKMGNALHGQCLLLYCVIVGAKIFRLGPTF